VTFRLTAEAGTFSDGEEHIIPILKNRVLVMETLPLPVAPGQEKTFSFDKLIQSGNSSTLKHHRLTLEFTANPVWNAVLALPYLMEYPYECMEQIFSRYYANTIASFILKSNPRIQKVYELWKAQARQKDSPNANAFLATLEKNPELKSILTQETPWLVEGKTESERREHLAQLFDENLFASHINDALGMLMEGQLENGAWPWFKGMRENTYITQYIVAGFARLREMKLIDLGSDWHTSKMLSDAIRFIDKENVKEYLWRTKAKEPQSFHLLPEQAFYLYVRSFFPDVPMEKDCRAAFDYFKNLARDQWMKIDNNYIRAMIAVVFNRSNESKTAQTIMASIKEHALYSEESGMYWKSLSGYYWYESPVETQVMLIEAFDEILHDQQSIARMKTWLIKQKQVQDWGNTKATANACYALLLKGDDLTKESNAPLITLGKVNPVVIEPGKTGPNDEVLKAEAGTGYFKVSWNRSEIRPEMGNVTVKNTNNVATYGGFYWQYFENLDKITPAQTPLKITRNLFVGKTSEKGTQYQPIEEGVVLNIGDRVKVQLEIHVDRDMEFVFMKDMRASALEPEEVLSGNKWANGFWYYQSPRDAATNFFIDYLPKGRYVIEYALRVTHVGQFSNGIASIQCMYAPEFTAHSQGIRIKVE